MSELLEVHLLGVPVALWAEAQEHTDELIREFTLLAVSLRETGSHNEVPVRLVELLEALTERYSAVTADQETILAKAALNSEAEIDDLVFRVPAEAAAASVRLRALLEEADDYCRAGQHLLTLATPPEIVRFRNWYLEAFSDQLAGKPPTPWSDYPA